MSEFNEFPKDSYIYISPKSEIKVEDATLGVKFSNDIFLLKSFLDKKNIEYKEEELEDGPFGKFLRIKRNKK